MPDITISLTAAQAQRVQAAFARRFGNPAFGVPEYKQWLIAQTRDVVLAEEKRAAIDAAKSNYDAAVEAAESLRAAAVVAAQTNKTPFQPT